MVAWLSSTQSPKILKSLWSRTTNEPNTCPARLQNRCKAVRGTYMSAALSCDILIYARAKVVELLQQLHVSMVVMLVMLKTERYSRWSWQTRPAPTSVLGFHLFALRFSSCLDTLTSVCLSIQCKFKPVA